MISQTDNKEPSSDDKKRVGVMSRIVVQGALVG